MASYISVGALTAETDDMILTYNCNYYHLAPTYIVYMCMVYSYVEGYSFRERVLYQPDVGDFLNAEYASLLQVFAHFAKLGQAESKNHQGGTIPFHAWLNMINEAFLMEVKYIHNIP